MFYTQSKTSNLSPIYQISSVEDVTSTLDKNRINDLRRIFVNNLCIIFQDVTSYYQRKNKSTKKLNEIKKNYVCLQLKRDCRRKVT
jgi:hypothetical protein